jgi:hypothetical protein
MAMNSTKWAGDVMEDLGMSKSAVVAAARAL